jgi:hypothetical protein
MNQAAEDLTGNRKYAGIVQKNLNTKKCSRKKGYGLKVFSL